MEQWKPILGYEGFYEVSDMGRVRRVRGIVECSSTGGCRRVRGHMLRQNVKRNGYKTVDLSKAGKATTTLVHRLVAEAFCDKPEGAEQVNHINYNRADNRAVNLEWCTCLENNRHAHKRECRVHSALRKKLICVETGEVFESSYQAAEWVNGHKRQYSGNTATMARGIRGAATHPGRTAFGYHWEDVVDQPSTTIPEGSTPKRVEMGCPS